MRNARILNITATLPAPDQMSGDQRYFQILKLLARDHEVDLCAFATPEEPAYARKYGSMLRDIGVNVLPQRWRNREWAVSQKVYDLILGECWFSADGAVPLIRRCQPWAPIVVDTVDVHFLREEMGVKLGVLDATHLAERKALELGTYRAVDALLLVTPDDGKSLRAASCNTRQYLVPNVVHPRPRPVKERQKSLIFVGGFRHQPNVDGMTWFAKEIWPAIIAQRPYTMLNIVGSAMRPEIVALGQQPNVRLHADVPSVTPLLDDSAVSIAPLRFGAGMKGKVTEAMANGLPIVTTSIGAQGLNATNDVHLKVADEPGRFAEAVIALLDNPAAANAMGAAARELIVGLCGEPAVDSVITQMLTDLLPKEPPLTPSPAMRLERAQMAVKTFTRPAVMAARGIKPKPNT